MSKVVLREEIQHMLKEYGHYLAVPKGVSMWPMLKSKENVVDIVPASGVLKKYDLALYYRETDKSCVLHRVIEVREKDYIIYGDNCVLREKVPHEAVMGVAAKFYRKGKWTSVRDKKYMFYVHVWCDFIPFRTIIFRLRSKIKTWLRKTKA